MTDLTPHELSVVLRALDSWAIFGDDPAFTLEEQGAERDTARSLAASLRELADSEPSSIVLTAQRA
jgi:hypothetical protein